ncbi:ABC transporter permease [Leifsonia poae]|uniref:ABC transporter permease n=1 Tax=Leifsonia poae TaxID=110933 RepID=UPI001CBBA3ED|nr:ABC transporter permease [Leifsonia poae]
MTDIIAAFAWVLDPAHWGGPSGIGVRLGEHVWYSFLTLILAAVIALPIGFAIGHTGRFRGLAIGVSGALRAIPTLGLVVYLALITLNLSIVPPLIALTILAIPPVLAGAYSGLESVDRRTIDAARAMGMTEMQILVKVELPLSLPLIIGGLRSAALQVIATWTVAAILPVGGLGRFLFDGLSVQNYGEMLGGSILVIVLALITDGLFALIQRLVVPRGVAAGKVEDVRTKDPWRPLGIVVPGRSPN